MLTDVQVGELQVKEVERMEGGSVCKSNGNGRRITDRKPQRN